MLPFLKPKKQAGVVGVITKSDGSSEPDMSHDGVIAAAEDLLSAIAMKDASAVAEALMAAFMIMNSMPHEEDEHVE